MGTSFAADSAGLPVSTTHVPSSGVARWPSGMIARVDASQAVVSFEGKGPELQ